MLVDSETPTVLSGITGDQIGASFTELTVIENVAVLESSVPSFALKVNESAPL